MSLRLKYGFDATDIIPEPTDLEIIEGTNRNMLGCIARKLGVYVNDGHDDLVLANFMAIKSVDKDVYQMLIEYFNIYEKYEAEYSQYLDRKDMKETFDDDYLIQLHELHHQVGVKRTAPFILVYLRYPDSKYKF